MKEDGLGAEGFSGRTQKPPCPISDNDQRNIFIDNERL
jgi:hypothetical protein